MPLDTLTAALAPAGLNLFAVASAAAWDAVATPARTTAALLPGARSVVVFGSGGPALWDAMLADLRAHPQRLAEEEHPLDAFVRRALDAADAALDADPRSAGVPRRWFRAAADETVHVDFRLLASVAGLGTRSRLGLLMHPTYGPWLGLRAACFLAADLAPTAPHADSPCDTCAAPCVAACPGAAFPGGDWSVDACSAFNQASTDCRAGCHARVACPVGAEHRYGADELLYHYDRFAGRRRLRALVGLPDAADRHEGVGPHWGGWRARVDVAK